MYLDSLKNKAENYHELFIQDSKKVERFFTDLVEDTTIEGTKITVNTMFSIQDDHETAIIFENDKYFWGGNTLKLSIIVKDKKVSFKINYPSGGQQDNVPQEDILACLHSFTVSAMDIVKAAKINPDIYIDMFALNYKLRQDEDIALKDLHNAQSKAKADAFNNKVEAILKKLTVANNICIDKLYNKIINTTLEYDEYGNAKAVTYNLMRFTPYHYNNNVLINDVSIKVSETANGSRQYELCHSRVAKSKLLDAIKEMQIIKINNDYPQSTQEAFTLAGIEYDNSKLSGIHLEMKIDSLVELVS
jgi:hypothetical protein